MMKKILLHRFNSAVDLHRLMHRPIREVSRTGAGHATKQPQLQVGVVAPVAHPPSKKDMAQPKPIAIHLRRRLRVRLEHAANLRLQLRRSVLHPRRATAPTSPTHLSIAEFFCSANPFHASEKTFAPNDLAISTVRIGRAGVDDDDLIGKPRRWRAFARGSSASLSVMMATESVDRGMPCLFYLPCTNRQTC